MFFLSIKCRIIIIFKFKMQFSDIFQNSTKAGFSPNGKHMFILSNNKLHIKLTAKVHDMASENIITIGEGSTDITYSPDSDYIMVLYGRKNIVQAYSVKGNWTCKIEDQYPGILHAVWAPDSRQILTFSDFQSRVSIYNLTSKQTCYIKGHKHHNKGYSFSSDGKWMALAQRRETKDCVGIYFTKDWTCVNYLKDLEMLDLVDLAWAPNNMYIVAWDNCLNYRLLALDPLKGMVCKFQPCKYELGIKSVKYSNNSLFVAVGSYDEKIRLLNALTWKLIGELQCTNVVTSHQNLQPLRQEQYKQNNRIQSHLLLIETSTFKIPSVKVTVNEKTLSAPNQGIGLLEFSKDDRFMACRNDNMPNVVWIWDVSRLQLKSVILFLAPVKGFKWGNNQDKARLCMYTGTAKIFFWSPDETFVCDIPFETKLFCVQKIKWSEDDAKVILFDKSDICICETELAWVNG